MDGKLLWKELKGRCKEHIDGDMEEAVFLLYQVRIVSLLSCFDYKLLLPTNDSHIFIDS
jgi:hypothetical protein